MGVSVVFILSSRSLDTYCLCLFLSETSHFLLVTVKKKVLRFNVADPEPEPEELPVKNLSNVIAIDFDMKNNCLFYGDVQNDIIAVSWLVTNVHWNWMYLFCSCEGGENELVSYSNEI